MKKYPELHKLIILRVCIPFVLGITLSIQNHIEFSDSIVFIISILLLLFLLVVNISKRIIPFKNQWIHGILIFKIFILLGYLFQRQSETPYTRLVTDKEYTFIAEISKLPEKKEYGLKGTLETLSPLSDNLPIGNHKILFYLYDNQKLEIGYKYIIHGKLQDISGPSYSGQFNYKKYLALRGIHYKVYISNFERIGKSKFSVISFANRLREKSELIFSKYIKQQNLAGVSSAMILGRKELLDENTKSDFIAAGAMHVLAVSGLHVGLIFLILTFLLKFLNKHRIGRFISLILSISVLSFYTLLAGLSPSVVRASIMFSFLLIGKTINRRSNTYNILALSCLIILLIDPNSVFDIGFQLSYLAVLSIIFFQPRIEKIFIFKNRILKTLWALTVVCFAAQILTFPVSIFNFHQFPIYFWLSNLVVVLQTKIILILSIILIIVSPLNIIANFTGKILSFIISTQLSFVEWIHKLPLSLISDIYISYTELILIYIAIFSIAALIISQKRYWIHILLGIILLIPLVNLHTTIKTKSGNHLSIFESYKNTEIVYFTNFNSLHFNLNTKSTKTKNIRKNIREIASAFNLCSDQQIQEIQSPIAKTKNYYLNNNYLVIDTNRIIKVFSLRDLQLSLLLKPDILIFEKYIHEIDTFISHNKQKIILGGNLNNYERKRFKELFYKKNIECWDLKNDGAFNLSRKKKVKTIKL